MKILHINSYYVSRELYKNMYDYQNDNGHTISVFVPVRIGRKPGKFERGEYTILSYDFLEFDRYIFHLKHHKILKDMEKHYSNMDFDIMHAHSLFSNGYIAYKLKKKYNIPYVVAVRNTDVNDFFEKLFYLRKLGNKILENADKIIFLSEAYKESVINNYVNRKEDIRRKSVVIPNGIDPFWLAHKRVEGRDAPSDGRINVISVGTIDKNKNFITSRKAVEQLKQDGFDICWTVIGKIIDKEVEKDISSCPLVKYKPPIKREELIIDYGENDLFLLPSISETFGLTYAEALTQGLPIIYTRGQGFDRQFPEGTVGFSVDCFDINEICNCIKRIMHDYRTFSKNCVLGCTKFDWNTINNSYIEMYNSVIC